MRWLPRGHPDRRPRTRSELAVAAAMLLLAVALPVLVAVDVLAGTAARWLGALAFVGAALFVIVKVRGHRNEQQSTLARVLLAVASLALIGYVAYLIVTGETGV